MEYTSIPANDLCTLSFQTSLPIPQTTPNSLYKTLIILLHGFAGSSSYFRHNTSTLSTSAWTVALDLRGHGRSGRPNGGYHVARLASDLRDIIAYLRAAVSDPEIAIVGVGCSIGAAVLWTYTELFTDADFAGLVFVDQAPLQNRSLAGGSNWDARFAHRSCYDAATLAAAQTLWAGGSEAAFVGLVDGCLGYRFAPLGSDDVSAERRVADEAFFVGEAKRCDGAWLAALMGDHTVYDHREACEGIRVPVLVMAGKRTGCFPLEGMREVVRRVEKGCVDRGVAGMKSSVAWSEFDGGHWLFWEEPDRFNREVIAFVKECVQE